MENSYEGAIGRSIIGGCHSDTGVVEIRDERDVCDL